MFYIVLREYSKFRIELNSYFSIRFDSKWAQLFEIFWILTITNFLLIQQNDADFITLATTPSNQKKLTNMESSSVV